MVQGQQQPSDHVVSRHNNCARSRGATRKSKGCAASFAPVFWPGIALVQRDTGQVRHQKRHSSSPAMTCTAAVADDRIGGAQRFMAPHDVVKRRLQRGTSSAPVRRRPPPCCKTHCRVPAGPGTTTLLRERQGQPALRSAGSGATTASCVAHPLPPDPLSAASIRLLATSRQCMQHRRFENGAQRQLRTAPCAHLETSWAASSEWPPSVKK